VQGGTKARTGAYEAVREDAGLKFQRRRRPLSTDQGPIRDVLPQEDLRCILYIAMAMKRTQLYLDEEMARTLAALGRQKSKTVSELVRESVQEKYMTKQEIDKGSLARHLSGIWRHRKDLKDIERAVRKLRKGNRLKGLGVV